MKSSMKLVGYQDKEFSRNQDVVIIAITDQASLDAVRLDGNEGALHLESQQRGVLASLTKESHDILQCHVNWRWKRSGGVRRAQHNKSYITQVHNTESMTKLHGSPHSISWQHRHVVRLAVILEREKGGPLADRSSISGPQHKKKTNQKKREAGAGQVYLCGVSLLVLEHVNCGEDRQSCGLLICQRVRIAAGFHSSQQMQSYHRTRPITVRSE